MSSAMRATSSYPKRMGRRVLPPGAAPASPWSDRRADHGYGATAEPDWRSIDWREQLRTVDVEGTPVNYVDLGAGEPEPVVFVHGLGGQWQNWLENIPRVAQERRTLAIDLPGFGLTPEPPDRITIPGYGRLVDAFCERLELGRVALVGNSMGGYITAEVAIQFPARVSRLVLVSAAGISSAATVQAPILTAGRVFMAVATYTAARQRQLAARPLSRHLSLALVARHPRLLRADLAYEGFFKGVRKPGFDDALRASLDYDFRERLPDVGVPTLIVWGEKDAIIPVRDANEFERLIPDSRKVVMRDTGHIPMAERPQAFNDLLMEFLAETGAAEEKEPVEGQSQVV
jgi:pimeloyl-ACP methyl ester carboxylesterase